MFLLEPENVTLPYRIRSQKSKQPFFEDLAGRGIRRAVDQQLEPPDRFARRLDKEYNEQIVKKVLVYPTSSRKESSMKQKTWSWGIGIFLLVTCAGAADLPTAIDGQAKLDVAVEAPAYDFSVLHTTEVATSEDELIAILNQEQIRHVAMCGAQCGDGYCICTGSDDCCDDVCSFGCSLCENPPCVVIGEDIGIAPPGEEGRN